MKKRWMWKTKLGKVSYGSKRVEEHQTKKNLWSIQLYGWAPLPLPSTSFSRSYFVILQYIRVIYHPTTFSCWWEHSNISWVVIEEVQFWSCDNFYGRTGTYSWGWGVAIGAVVLNSIFGFSECIGKRKNAEKGERRRKNRKKRE